MGGESHRSSASLAGFGRVRWAGRKRGSRVRRDYRAKLLILCLSGISRSQHPPPAPGRRWWRGAERVGDAQPRAQPGPGGSGAVSLNAQRSRGQRAANAFPWHRGGRGCGAAGCAGFRSLAAEQGRASRWPRRLGSTPATPPALPGACDAQRGQAAAEPTARRPASPASLPSPAHQLLPREPNFCCGLGLRSPSGSERSAGWRPEQLRPAEMTSRLWLWCLCTWVAAGWPPGSAVQLRPDM